VTENEPGDGEEPDSKDAQAGEAGRGEPQKDGIRRKLAEQIIAGLIDSGSKIRRGQDLVTGVAQGTKEELVKLVGAEVRGFLDKMDIVDLAQNVVEGLVVEVKTEIRFRRDEEGKLQPVVEKNDVVLAEDDVEPE
jgi:hypothetical protein